MYVMHQIRETSHALVAAHEKKKRSPRRGAEGFKTCFAVMAAVKWCCIGGQVVVNLGLAVEEWGG